MHWNFARRMENSWIFLKNSCKNMQKFTKCIQNELQGKFSKNYVKFY